MNLIDNWKQVARGAWSFLISAISAVVFAAGAAWEYFAPEDLGIPLHVWLAVASGLALATGGARLIRQDKLAAKIAAMVKDELGAMSRRAMAGTVAAVMAVSVPLVAKWEGERTTAYRDVVGVWTVCYGETEGVKAGDTYTSAECKAMLGERVEEFYNGFRKCVPQIQFAPPEVQAAVTSWSYNVGLGAACSSTLARYARIMEWGQVCDQLPRWNRAGGRVINGLVNRRAEERRLCLSGLD